MLIWYTKIFWVGGIRNTNFFVFKLTSVDHVWNHGYHSAMPICTHTYLDDSVIGLDACLHGWAAIEDFLHKDGHVFGECEAEPILLPLHYQSPFLPLTTWRWKVRGWIEGGYKVWLEVREGKDIVWGIISWFRCHLIPSDTDASHAYMNAHMMLATHSIKLTANIYTTQKTHLIYMTASTTSMNVIIFFGQSYFFYQSPPMV